MKPREPFIYYRLVWLIVTLFLVPMIFLRTGRGYISGLAFIPFFALIAWQVVAIKYLIRNRGVAPWDWALLLLSIVCFIGFFAIPFR